MSNGLFLQSILSQDVRVDQLSSCSATPSSPTHLNHTRPALDQPHLYSSTCIQMLQIRTRRGAFSVCQRPSSRNTNKSTKWALNNFEAWVKTRNTSCPDNPVPEGTLMSSNPEALNLHLSRFVIETRKANGEVYLPTLHQLLCEILGSCEKKP